MSTLDSGAIAARIIALRDHTGPRVALRRGTSTATEHYAYPYLVPLWGDAWWARTPLLRVASLAAITTDVADNPDVLLGRFLRRVSLADLPAAPSNEATDRALSRIGKRLVWAQTGDVEKLHLVLRQLVVGVDVARPAVSWRHVVDTYLWWDQRNAERRRLHRRRLLEHFYTPMFNGDHNGDATPTAAVAANE